MIRDLLFDYTFRNVALGAATLGVVSGVLGSFAVLRRQSLLGDAISHAALPGIVIAYMLTRSRTPGLLLTGAAIAGWLGALTVMGIVRRSRVKYDSALGIVLSVFFGAGLVLLTFLQRGEDAGQAGLQNFLFGQAASLIAADVATMAAFGAAALLITLAFWKEFKILAFDPDYGTSLGFAARRIDILLTTCLVIAIVIGLQAVGVVLMSAMVVAPGAAARQWTDRLGVMVLLAAGFGAAAGVAGAVMSASIVDLPTGPTIVVCAGGIVLASLLFAPHRGLVWDAARRARSRRRTRVHTVLADLYTLARSHDDPRHAHPVETLEAINPDRSSVRPSLDALRDDGLVSGSDETGWTLTPAGRAEAEQIGAAESGEAP